MSRQIQVANLSDSVDDGALAALFAPHGDVRRATVSTHFDTGHSTGVGFVEMKCDKEADAAVAALSGREHLGQVLSVCWSGPQPKSKPNETAGPEAGGFGDRGGTDSVGD